MKAARNLIWICLLGAVLLLPAVAQAQFIFTTNSDGSLNIELYTGTSPVVIIPDTTNSLPITSIGQGAFAGGRYGLSSVTIGTNVSSIGQSAFYQCLSLTNIIIPDSVTSIGGSAFAYCTNLTSVTIPSSIISIGDEAFLDCTSLTAITVAADNPAYSSVNGVLFNESQTTLVEYPGAAAESYTIPNSVTGIGDEAFLGRTSLTNITIPNSVTNIGAETFENCYGLNNVIIGANVASIGTNAFRSCKNLAGVTIPNSVTNIGEYAFYECISLTNVTIPDSVTSIGEAAFYWCTNLTSVTILNSVIGSAMFQECGRLTNVIIGTHVTSIGEGAFAGCQTLASVTIPDSVLNIGEGAFSGWAVTNVTIPNSVTNIGANAFTGPNLLGVYFQGNAPTVSSNLPLYNYVMTTAYYLPGTSGWSEFASNGMTAMLWNPQAQNFGVRTNQFGFKIIGITNVVIVVEASTNPANPVWTPIATNKLSTFVGTSGTNGTSYFSDPQWANFPGRFYRFSSP